MEEKFSPSVDNRQQAMQRLVLREKKLEKNPETAKSYCQAMNQYVIDGHSKEITKDCG